MGGRRSLMPKISGGEITFQFFCWSATLIMNGQTDSRCVMLSPLLFFQAYLCLLFVVFFLDLGPIAF